MSLTSQTRLCSIKDKDNSKEHSFNSGKTVVKNGSGGTTVPKNIDILFVIYVSFIFITTSPTWGSPCTLYFFCLVILSNLSLSIYLILNIHIL